MSVIRRSLKEQYISIRDSEIILGSWRHLTKKQYKVYINKWILFCHKRKIDTVHTSVGLGLDFLAELFDNGLKYSALNTVRSALSSFVLLSTGQSFGSHHLVIRFLRAVYNDRPSLPRYKDIWNVDFVLNLLRK